MPPSFETLPARPVMASVPKPVAPNDAFAPAPVPDLDAAAPVPSRRTQIAPATFLNTRDHRGDGYVYGSSPQGRNDDRALAIPGVNFSIPMR